MEENPTVLVVDDEPLLRGITCEVLEDAGYRVTCASSGFEAFDLIKSQKIACVVSDIRMPNGTGIELAKMIFQMEGPKPSIIFVTGYSDLDLIDAKKIGVKNIVFKPYDPQNLVEEVERVILEDWFVNQSNGGKGLG